MARPRAANSRTITIALKVSEAEAQALDRLRGAMPRGVWCRYALLKVIRSAHEAQGAPR